jgi:trehalose 6-phosphate synthase
MNLVAKEYVAALDPENPGVLVLSRFAGAARQMPDAVIINPYSREEVSEGLKIALSMPLAERIRRWRRLMEGIQASNVKVWRDSFVEALRASREPDLPFGDRLRERDTGGSEAAFADAAPSEARQAQFGAE